MKQNNKFSYWIVILIISIICVLLFYLYLKSDRLDKFIVESARDSKPTISDNIDMEKKKTQAIIQNIINEEIKIDEKYYLMEEDNSIESLIGESIEETKEENQSSYTIVEVISGNKVKVKIDDVEKEVRLIGLKDGASKEGLENLINNSTDIVFEFDMIKEKDEVLQAYLWNGDISKDKSNMINIQMISNGYAITTYMNQQDSIVETPNIKYSTTFIKVQKDKN